MVAEVSAGSDVKMPSGGTATYTQDLVSSIKAWQREGGPNNRRWHDYCDNEQRGIRDPRCHSVNALKDFCRKVCEWERPRAGENGSDIVDNLSRAKIVQIIRRFQRQGKENRERWNLYCDEYGGGFYEGRRYIGVRDTSRLELARLKAFVRKYDLLGTDAGTAHADGYTTSAPAGVGEEMNSHGGPTKSKRRYLGKQGWAPTLPPR